MATVLSNTGRTLVQNRLSGAASTSPIYVGWGTGTGTSAVADTTLFTEDSAGSPVYTRAVGTGSIVTTSVTNDTYQVVGTLTANAAKTITNSGTFDSALGGTNNLFIKSDFTGVALNNGDSITLTYKWQIS